MNATMVGNSVKPFAQAITGTNFWVIGVTRLGFLFLFLSVISVSSGLLVLKCKAVMNSEHLSSGTQVRKGKHLSSGLLFPKCEPLLNCMLLSICCWMRWIRVATILLVTLNYVERTQNPEFPLSKEKRINEKNMKINRINWTTKWLTICQYSIWRIFFFSQLNLPT